MLLINHRQINYRQIESFFLDPSSTRPLAVFRIVFGMFALTEMLSLRSNWLDLLGNEGIIQWVISKELFAVNGVPHIFHVASVLKPWGISEDMTVYIFIYSYILSLIALICGFHTRLAALSAWFLHVIIWNTGSLHGYGVESFTRVCLFYCIFMPVSDWWAINRVRREMVPSDSASWAATLSYRVLQLHLCIVYLSSGIAKMQGEQWRHGEALWRALVQPEYSTCDLFWLAHVPWVVCLLSWTVLFFEAGYAFLIWPAKTRAFMLCSMISMHIGIALFMGLWGFATVMIILNLAAFGHCTDFRQLNILRLFAHGKSVNPPPAAHYS